MIVIYTLPQKKRNFNFQIFHGDPGPLLPKRKATSEKLRFFWGRVYSYDIIIRIWGWVCVVWEILTLLGFKKNVQNIGRSLTKTIDLYPPTTFYPIEQFLELVIYKLCFYK